MVLDMMQIPESQKQHNDLIDIVVEASQNVEEITLEDGRTQKELVLDPEIIWWKTQIVNCPTFARFAFELKTFEHLAVQCYDNMSKKRADTIARQILAIVASFKRSIDAKSSESLRDKNNTQSTLIDKINKNKIERAYTLKGEAKKTFMDGIMGNDARRDREDE